METAEANFVRGLDAAVTLISGISDQVYEEAEELYDDPRELCAFLLRNAIKRRLEEIGLDRG